MARITQKEMEDGIMSLSLKNNRQSQHKKFRRKYKEMEKLHMESRHIEADKITDELIAMKWSKQ
jgi:hypothetical protein